MTAMDALFAMLVSLLYFCFIIWILKHVYDAIVTFLKLFDRAVTAFERFVDIQSDKQ